MNETSSTETSNAHEFTVSQISKAVKSSVEEQFGHVRVRGEVGRLSRPGSGHIYFDLKDDKAVLAAVAWKGVASRWRFQPEQGLEVIVTGKLTTFPGQSKYQIIVENVEPAGVGALMALLEERRKKLTAEGLFDEDKKQSLPFLPMVIGVVTSPSGAVIRDILHRLEERFPTHVIVWPVRVQGPSSAKEVAAAVEGFNMLPPDGNIARPDLIIVARGGGSIEDLWSFNEEEVVRAISESSIPLISAIGHETDMSLADFAADKRAPTPTAAAEIAVPVRAELIGYINDLNSRKYTGTLRNISSLRDRLRAVSAGLPGADDLVAQARQRLDLASTKLSAALNVSRQAKALGLARVAPRLSSRVLKNLLEEHKSRVLAASQRSGVALSNRTQNSRLQMVPVANRLEPAMALKIREKRRELKASFQLLNSLGYRNVLERGFVLVMDKNQQVVKRAKNLSAGDNVTLRFADSERGAIIDNGDDTPAGSVKKIKKPPVTPQKTHGKPDDGQTSLF
ncbi:MAG: exodeoxyribonuclease VII large subunit [Devosiaceae bacterium]|nr:exodeoxyribonuclease VII large subunit [Devosiaceae bacterium]